METEISKSGIFIIITALLSLCGIIYSEVNGKINAQAEQLVKLTDRIDKLEKKFAVSINLIHTKTPSIKFPSETF